MKKGDILLSLPLDKNKKFKKDEFSKLDIDLLVDNLKKHPSLRKEFFGGYQKGGGSRFKSEQINNLFTKDSIDYYTQKIRENDNLFSNDKEYKQFKAMTGGGLYDAMNGLISGIETCFNFCFCTDTNKPIMEVNPTDPLAKGHAKDPNIVVKPLQPVKKTSAPKSIPKTDEVVQALPKTSKPLPVPKVLLPTQGIIKPIALRPKGSSAPPPVPPSPSPPPLPPPPPPSTTLRSEKRLSGDHRRVVYKLLAICSDIGRKLVVLKLTNNINYIPDYSIENNIYRKLDQLGTDEGTFKNYLTTIEKRKVRDIELEAKKYVFEYYGGGYATLKDKITVGHMSRMISGGVPKIVTLNSPKLSLVDKEFEFLLVGNPRNNRCVYILMEYNDNYETLHEHIDSRGSLDHRYGDVPKYFVEIEKATGLLYDLGLVHGDFHYENVLVLKRGRTDNVGVKIFDLDFGCWFNNPTQIEQKKALENMSSSEYERKLNNDAIFNKKLFELYLQLNKKYYNDIYFHLQIYHNYRLRIFDLWRLWGCISEQLENYLHRKHNYGKFFRIFNTNRIIQRLKYDNPGFDCFEYFPVREVWIVLRDISPATTNPRTFARQQKNKKSRRRNRKKLRRRRRTKSKTRSKSRKRQSKTK